MDSSNPTRSKADAAGTTKPRIHVRRQVPT